MRSLLQCLMKQVWTLYYKQIHKSNHLTSTMPYLHYLLVCKIPKGVLCKFIVIGHVELAHIEKWVLMGVHRTLDIYGLSIGIWLDFYGVPVRFLLLSLWNVVWFLWGFNWISMGFSSDYMYTMGYSSDYIRRIHWNTFTGILIDSYWIYTG